MAKVIIRGRGITAGVARGTALVSLKPFGFSHGIEPETGLVSDSGHEWLGQDVKGKVLIFPNGKGSTSGGLYILEAVRLANAPAAVINLEADPVTAGGFIMAGLLYGRNIPIIDRPDSSPFGLVKTGDMVTVNADTGTIEVEPSSSSGC